ncbi:MAG: efflux RND transporter permease subunit [Polyangiales bacterium]
MGTTNLTRAKKRLTFIVPITIGIIFALLFFMFRSPLYASVLLMNVPFSLVGGIVALWLRGIKLSVWPPWVSFRSSALQ